MAKRKNKSTSTQSRSSGNRRTRSLAAIESSGSQSSSTDFGESRFMNKVKDLYDNPAVRYIAGGLAASALVKFVDSFGKRYPEITNILRGSFDSIEQKLADFKENSQSSASDDETSSFQH